MIHAGRRVTGCQSREELGVRGKKLLLAEKGKTFCQKAGQNNKYIDG
jgi:hypothetical protein